MKNGCCINVKIWINIMINGSFRNKNKKKLGVPEQMTTEKIEFS